MASKAKSKKRSKTRVRSKSQEIIKNLRGLDVPKVITPIPFDMLEEENPKPKEPEDTHTVLANAAVITDATDQQTYWPIHYIDPSGGYEIEDRRGPDDLTDWQSRGELR